jgi:hypothetical protein
MVPLATCRLPPEQPLWRKAVKRLLRRPPPQVQVLYPTGGWPSARFYWDLVERQLRSMCRPFLSLAIRTDAPDSAVAARARRIFDALPQHPLAEWLRFEDPLDIAPGLV